eukprot:CAMPEP_0167747224 /NCGR_PEP_ID=MMETSP0110_2-20121227/4163_1 /TAXON_ID=629695 /ORGANISM="Gymnochlora sp., Strain CCMP2014" /LENGTH=227 /DNA_ID=CAMNT_0007632103 /DNA_START=27 /DNA_END=713 /DNA_ORIENTATION=+
MAVFALLIWLNGVLAVPEVHGRAYVNGRIVGKTKEMACSSISSYSSRLRDRLSVWSAKIKLVDPAEKRMREEDERRKREFVANKGRLIDWLRSDVPFVFESPLNFDSFRDDVQLKIVIRQLGLETQIKGKKYYKSVNLAIRVSSKLFFDFAKVARVKIQKDPDPMSPSICVRWKVEAKFLIAPEPIRLAFVSVFELDETGLVQEVLLTDVDPPSKLFLCAPAPSKSS